MVIRRPHIVLEIDAIFQIVGKVAFGLKLVDAIEAIVAPALANFEFALIDTKHHL